MVVVLVFGQDQIDLDTATETSPQTSATNQETSAPATPLPKGQYLVHRVVDGDTVRVWVDGESEPIRIIGLDTPETVDPRKPVQCFGKEASNKATELLAGQIVGLELDETQGDRDTYDRMLRYVILPDGRNFSQVMIQEGYAFEYTYQSNPYNYQVEFQAAELQARKTKTGLWSPETCDGEVK